MLRVSGPDLVIAACRAGVIGAFPTANARSVEELDAWLCHIAAMTSDAKPEPAPHCANLIIRQPRLADDLACLLRHRAFTGLDTSMLLPSIKASGLDPAKLDEQVTARHATEMFGGKQAASGKRRWADVWSAGHSVSGVDTVRGAAELVERTIGEYENARRASAEAVDQSGD